MATENDVETRLGKRIRDSYVEEAGGEYARKYKAMKETVAQCEEEEKALSEKCIAADKALVDVMRKKRAVIQAFDQEDVDLHLSTCHSITAKKAGTDEIMVRWVWIFDDAMIVSNAVRNLIHRADITFDEDSVPLGDVNEMRKRDLRGATTLQDIIHGFLKFFNMRIYSISLSIPDCDDTKYEVFKYAAEMNIVLCRFFAAISAKNARRQFSISVDMNDTLDSYSSKFICELIRQRDLDAIVARLLEAVE